MSKKIKAFQAVSEAIDLDSSGLQELAFTKYLECLQSLSSFLVDQFTISNYSTMTDVCRKETKQVLSVVCDCVDRANTILKLQDPDAKLSDPIMTGSSNFGAHSILPKDQFPHCGVIHSHKPLSDSTISSLQNIPSRSRSEVFSKMDKENELVFKKYQARVENAKDRISRQNLELQLQRGLTENLMIAQSKQAQALKQQQEDRKLNLEVAMRNFLLEGPCSNKAEQEKRELYIEVLKHETKHLQHSDYTGLSTSQTVNVIFQRTLRCSSHPLTQWLLMVQIKLKKELFALLKDYSHFLPLLPEPINKTNLAVSSVNANIDEDSFYDLLKSLEEISQSVRDATDVVVEILYAVYKDQLPNDAEVLAFKLTESLLVIPLWCLLISLTRIVNIESEWRVAETMRSCQKDPQECNFNLLADNEFHNHSISCVRKVPALLSLEDKLSLLVQVSQNAGHTNQTSENATSPSRKLLGADELVPVLSYILVQSGLPQFVSECRLLEMLIDPKYMLGEEGYSLSSFQTALCYLEMKKHIDPVPNYVPSAPALDSLNGT